MQSKLDYCAAMLSGRPSRRASLALMLSLSLSTTGCLSSLAKHSAALSAATTPVVDQATAAYHAAETLHDLRVDYDAVSEFDKAQPVYNPRTIRPLLSDNDIEIRLAVLAAFQCYVESLVDITSGTQSPALDAASKSVGSKLSALGNSLAPSIESTSGSAAASGSTTETTSAAPITPGIQNAISTAANALGQFLISRKIKKELPQRIKDMDPHLQALCDALEKDIDNLQDQERRDYNAMINLQTQFIRESTTLNPQQRREDIMKLPEIVRRQRAADQQLAELRASIVRLALTHHALAVDAQGNNPESLKNKLGDLATAGHDLGKFYLSMPTQ